MQKFVYPAVVYQDNFNNSYVVAIEDLYIAGEGDSVEEAHAQAKESLKRYIDGTIRYSLDFVEPTRFEEMRRKYPDKLVMLIECNVDDKNRVID